MSTNAAEMSVMDIRTDENKKERRKIMKNIVLISIAFMFLFTSYDGLAQLQSSLHIDQGMGTINQAILYVSMVLSSMFLPKIAIKKLGYKWCIALSMVGYIIWMGANGIGRWWSMTPASVIVGLVAAPLWTAQCSYFTLSAVRYADLTNETSEAVVTRFFGIFFFFFPLAELFGSIISSAVLFQGVENATEPVEAALELCGVKDCPWNNVTNVNLEKPSVKLIWTMVGVYVGLACIAVIIVIIFMNKLPEDTQESSTSLSKDVLELLAATFKQLANIPQILLIVITIYRGIKITYFIAEWSKSFISCGLGIWMVGLVNVPFGLTYACVSFISGRLVKHISRIPILILGALLDLVIQILLYLWMPHPNTTAVFYIISSLWGITYGILDTQLSAMYGSIFTTESEAAFSNHKMWESLGFIIAFAYSSALCTMVKTIILTCVLCVGMCGYLATEFYIRRRKSCNSL